MNASSASRRRVVVTGIGCVSPLGLDAPSSWEAALAGRSGVRHIDRFDVDGFPSQIAGLLPETPEPRDVDVKERRRMDDCVSYALCAAQEAVGDAKLEFDDPLRDRTAVSIGSGVGGLGTITGNQSVLDARGPRRVSPFTIPMTIANMPAGTVSIHFGVRGPNLCHVSACASGAHAIGEAARMIERGDIDVAIAGGTEAPVLPIALSGFANMKALSQRNDAPEAASRPFDTGRDGFVIGEGAGVVILESLEHARGRGAHIRGELLGYAATADAQHIAAPDESGEGAARCLRLALADAGLDPAAIGYLNAHATSTPAGDPAEVRAIRAVFGDTPALAVSSTKGMTGHLLGAAGALEAIFTVLALEHGALPPTVNLEDVDPDCAVDHVVARRDVAVDYALSNSFGFGGTNGCLVLGRLGA